VRALLARKNQRFVTAFPLSLSLSLSLSLARGRMRHADNPRASGKQDEGNRDGSQRKQAHRSQNAPARSSATISGRVRRHPLAPDTLRAAETTLYLPLPRARARYVPRLLLPVLGQKSRPEDERKPRETSRLVRIPQSVGTTRVLMQVSGFPDFRT
jgi:hypothetical protein